MCDVKNGPGKFEGEPCYAGEVFDAVMNGETETLDTADDRVIDVYEIDDDFRHRHGLKGSTFAILSETDDSGFFYTREVTKPELDKFRAEIEDGGEDQPQEDDYYLSSDEKSVLYMGNVVTSIQHDGYPSNQDAVMRELAAYVERSGYAPNVWKISDHGNPILISVLSCGCYFTEHDGEASKHPAVSERGN